jgi:hypothetical protein
MLVYTLIGVSSLPFSDELEHINFPIEKRWQECHAKSGCYKGDADNPLYF